MRRHAHSETKELSHFLQNINMMMMMMMMMMTSSLVRAGCNDVAVEKAPVGCYRVHGDDSDHHNICGDIMTMTIIAGTMGRLTLCNDNPNKSQNK
jgi:major membrane immunogen (membrane-anchored lipoprotein)